MKLLSERYHHLLGTERRLRAPYVISEVGEKIWASVIVRKFGSQRISGSIFFVCEDIDVVTSAKGAVKQG